MEEILDLMKAIPAVEVYYQLFREFKTNSEFKKMGNFFFKIFIDTELIILELTST